MLNKKEIQSHSMGKEKVEPTWATLTLDVVNQLLTHYDQLTRATKILWFSPRPFSSAAVVVIDETKYFVKRHAEVVRDVEGLCEEHRIMMHLETKGIPVSKIIRGNDQQTAFTLQGWTYEIHALGEGVDIYQDAISWSPFKSVAHAFAAGEMLARVHRASEDFPFGKRKVSPLVSCFDIWMSDDPIEATKDFMNDREGLLSYFKKKEWQKDFESILFPFYEEFKKYRNALKPLWTHNDWHASNLLWTDFSPNAKVATVLDFGLSNETYAIYDVATALERNVIEWLDINNEQKNVVHADAAIHFLRGYQSIRPFDDMEKRALLSILPLVHTDYALSEIDYFVRITRQIDAAYAAYHEFLMGHANWFNSQQGQTLIHAIAKELVI